MHKPSRNVGIHAVEIYFPKTFISQGELESFSGVSKGKYTVGLGQTNMAFVGDCEDVNSMALTVVQNLLEKFNIDPRSIGRLEVGTETLVDKSKSTKTVLMQLFSKYGNHNIEGVTSINACYGGTNAFFNTTNWVQSEAWDGRYGIVVTTDVAVYAKGPARPTGGAGAVAMLIGPDAPFVLEPLRCTFIDHAYDFYKPDMTSEFPTVDGQLSLQTYQKALANCYLGLKQKLRAERAEEFNLDKVDFCCFHTPFCKMVAKSFSTLFEIDMKEKVLTGKQFNQIVQTTLEEHKKQPLDQKVAAKVLQEYWNAKTAPSLHFSTNLGNIYTGSLYANLVSLITDPNIDLENKRILMFSYGSGLASSMFVLKCTSSASFISQKIKARERLENRVKVSCEAYDKLMEEKRVKYNKVPLKPEISSELLFDGTFYLESVDDKFRRNYVRKAATQSILVQNQTVADVKEDAHKSIEGAGARKINLVNGHLTKAAESEKMDDKQANNMLWTGFHKKTFKERLDHLKKLDSTLNLEAYETGGLNISIADIMVENCIGKLSLPMGLGLNFQINGKFYKVPMVVEEPSVIAACSSAAKFISDNGSGFKAYTTDPIMRGQMQILDCDVQIAIFEIEKLKKDIISYANLACQNMVARGGGVVGVVAKRIPCGNDLYMINPHASDMLVVELLINVCESMGANIINTVVEHTAPYVAELVGGRAGIKILTNLCPERKALATFEIPLDKMKWKSASGEEVAKRMMEAYLFAKHDVYRAVTHNKGIMNGMDAAAIATGQDWRAIEAAAHTYSEIKHGKYQPLTQYSIVKKPTGELVFKGSIDMPIALGTVGGVVQNNPIYQNNLKMLGFPNAKDLSQILVCVGLANNFAAMRALAIEGIQKGHMNLHAKNIALSAGVPHYLSMDAVEFMKSIGRISKDAASAYLGAIDLYTELRPERPKQSENAAVKSLSTFFVELNLEALSEPIILNIALNCQSEKPIHLAIEKNPRTKRTQQDITIQKQLFGDKGYEWLSSFFHELDLIKFSSINDDAIGSNKGKSQELCYKLKTLAILANILSSNLVKMNFNKVQEVYKVIKQNPNNESIKDLLKGESIPLRYGCFLLAELIKIAQYNLELTLPFEQIKALLLNEMYNIIESHLIAYEMWVEAIQKKRFDFERFLQSRRKRLSATMMLYCDALILRNAELNQNIISKMTVLGEIYELEGTMARDVSRWSLGEGEINAYSYWLLMKDLYRDGSQDRVRQQFVKNVMALSNPKKKTLDSNLLDQYEVTKCVIQGHYNVNDKVLPPNGGEPKL